MAAAALPEPAAAGSDERTVIVRLRDAPASGEHLALRRAASALLGASAPGRGSFVRELHFAPGFTARVPASAIVELRKDPRVLYVEEDVPFVRVEPRSELNVGFTTPGANIVAIGAQQLQEQGITGAGVNVAVLDTGIDCTHPALKDNCRAGYNFVASPPNANSADDDTGGDPTFGGVGGHGTRMAGIVAARPGPNGVVGVAPGATVHAVKVGNVNGVLPSAVVDGIDWSINNGIDVVNMSFATPASLEAQFPGIYKDLRDACARAQAAGLVLVAAAGNSATEGVQFPAAIESVVAVGASDATNAVADFSPAGDLLALVAPGVGILSTCGPSLCPMGQPVGGGYAAGSGTSEAAPHVAGVAALLLSSGASPPRDRNTVAKVIEAMKSSARPLGSNKPDRRYGSGLVQAPAAYARFTASAPKGGCATGGGGAGATALALVAAMSPRRRRPRPRSLS